LEVIDLVNQIRASCPGGTVTAANIDCIKNIRISPSSLDILVKWELSYSVSHHNWLQCVGFVLAAAARKYGYHLTGGGNYAINFATNPPAGFIFIPKSNGVAMKVHDLPIWNYGTTGHIAYTVNVYDAANFRVAEANLGCNGCVRFENKTTDNPYLIGWLRKV